MSAVASRFPTVSKPYLQLDYEKEQGPPRADEIRLRHDEIRLRHVEVVRCNESCGPCPLKKKNCTLSIVHLSTVHISTVHLSIVCLSIVHLSIILSILSVFFK